MATTDAAQHRRRRQNLAGFALAVIAAAAVVVPPIAYQVRHFELPWNDVGTYARSLWNVFDHGRFVVYSDGDSDFFIWQHFEPFFFLLCVPVRLFGTLGYVTLITGALVLSAGYVFLLTANICRSWWIGALAAAAFVANPYTYAIALSYHIETFGILFLLAFAHYGHAGRTRLAWLALVLALSVKEDMWVYAGVVSAILASRDRWKQSAAFGAAALGYYVIVVVLIGRSMYPTAHYLNTFYQIDGHPMTTPQVAGVLLGRWREYLPLLLTGPGFLFQLSMLFVGLFSGWRYVLICGVMLIWLSYPEGPPRTTFSYYYSYPALLLSFVNLPLALNNLRALGARLLPKSGRAGLWTAAAVLGAVIATDLVLHVPGHVPWPIDSVVNAQSVYGPQSRVNVPVVRFLIEKYLAGNSQSVLAQYFTITGIPQRPGMYITYKEGGRVLEGKLSPQFVLIDLSATDPIADRDTVLGLAMMLRRRDRYQPLWDDQDVLLYRLAGSETLR
jgi:uncharacterized membrane protein